MFEGNLLGCEHEYKMPLPCLVPVFGFCMKRRYLAVVYLDAVLCGDQLLIDGGLRDMGFCLSVYFSVCPFDV